MHLPPSLVPRLFPVDERGNDPAISPPQELTLNLQYLKRAKLLVYIHITELSADLRWAGAASRCNCNLTLTPVLQCKHPTVQVH